ncbi:recombinase family protein [Sinorhizobium prairiense]|uniref:recombinase family protein n=1 Tax=unclassified Sinorhizobium TaxID=2613772 RepID=UPI0023D7FE2D|nr:MULTISPECIES: recombinase family protein [unclassified Sinorhizobium]WEJ12921.1 recombinase family protein [Sinorhizobium sp. M103]WEJ18005.1 recombinase family protein [Sinorhizobium sp. K101]WEJ40046.1 recombinase family protein [Sinorhizobium sp. C101]
MPNEGEADHDPCGPYARYSSDSQSETPIEDQFRLCREHAGREQWEIVGFYEDAAISGSSTILRSGIQRLVRDAQLWTGSAAIRPMSPLSTSI